MLAKTSRPRLSAIYPRLRLFDRLDMALLYSATLVNGPPGAGKTTLIASYIAHRNLHCLWYQMDSGDEDVATFFHYFSQAANSQLVDDGIALPDFNAEAAADLVFYSRQFFRAFYDRVRAPHVVVLDNYQDLADNTRLHEVVKIACEETPVDCHIIIASREACPRQLARLRFNRMLTVIDGDELVLTLAETRGLIELEGVIPDSETVVLALQKRSAGWMMGLMLLLERWGGRNRSIDLTYFMREKPESRVFDYFIGEVFRKLDPECRNLLLQSALLPWMTFHRVTQLTGTARAGELLRQLMRRNHFVSRHGGREAAYQFHPLFREFLLHQIVEVYPRVDLALLCSRAAEVLLADDDEEAAIALLERAGNWPRLAEVILMTAPRLQAQGRIVTLETWMKKLPALQLNSNPWLLYWKESSLKFSHPGFTSGLEAVYQQFSKNDDLAGMAVSWTGLMAAFSCAHKDFREVDPWLAEFNERLGGRLDQLPVELRNRAAFAYFNALSMRGFRHARITPWLNRMRGILTQETNPAECALLRHHLVTHHLLRGEQEEAEFVLGMPDYELDLSGELRPARTMIDYANEAMVALHAGLHQRCLHAVDAGLRAAEDSGNSQSKSVLLQLGAVMSLNRGALIQTDAFLAAVEELGDVPPFLNRGAYAVAAWRRYQTGKTTSALQLMARALAASEARGIPYYIAEDSLGFGLLLHICGKTAEAQRMLENAHLIGVSIKNSLIEYVYQLFSAYVDWSRGCESMSHDHLVSAMRLGRRHGYMHFFHFPQRMIARMCLMALEAGIEPEYVGALIERNELTPDPSWRQVESWPWPIRIKALGHFSVIKNGLVLCFAGKVQKKPLELLKALIAFGGHDVPESKLADALWPQAEGDSALQVLRTTLFRLRKLIGEPVITRRDGRLSLNQTLCWVDCWAFERMFHENPIDRQKLEKFATLYKGSFLEGEEDIPWTHPMRQRLHSKFVQLARKTLPPF